MADDALYFTGANAEVGRELWRLDDGGASLVADIIPGTRSARVAVLGVLGDEVLFGAYTGLQQKYALWSFDGQEARMIWPSWLPYSDNVVFQDAFYFVGSGPDVGFELYRYDGASVNLVDDYTPGASSSVPDELTDFEDFLIFELHGRLWSYDGVDSYFLGRFRAENGKPNWLTPYRDRVYFSAGKPDFQEGVELWETDGLQASLFADTVPGPHGFDPLNPIYYDKSFIEFDNRLILYGDDENGRMEIWSFDGTELTETREFYHADSDFLPRIVAQYDDQLIYWSEGDDGQIWLWKTDGRQTVRLFNSNRVPEDLSFGLSSLENIHYGVDFQGERYFSWNGSLWKISPDWQGDFDDNGLLDVQDVNLLSTGIRAGDPAYDLTLDGAVDDADLRRLVTDYMHSRIGDANLDGQFNSADFVQVFQKGKYQNDEHGTAGWDEGDWNSDGLFDSSDMVTSFVEGGYEMGLRTDTGAVPEPSGWLSLATAVVLVAFQRRRAR